MTVKTHKERFKSFNDETLHLRAGRAWSRARDISSFEEGKAAGRKVRFNRGVSHTEPLKIGKE